MGNQRRQASILETLPDLSNKGRLTKYYIDPSKVPVPQDLQINAICISEKPKWHLEKGRKWYKLLE